MARPKSEEKRNTLLSVATQVFAKNGLTASTASITSAAGMAEGTLFIYFKGKDELINALYAEIKSDLADSMLVGLPKTGSVKDKMHHVWNNYVDWGAKNPERMTVMHKIKVWEGLKPEVRDQLMLRFSELHELTELVIRDSAKETPYDFLMAIFSAQAETTMQFVKQNPEQAELYKNRGFEMFWNGVTSKG